MGGVPSKPQPGKKLQVIGAGYSRTGTVSMQMALEKLLDGPVLHGGTAILGGADAHCRLWVEAYKAKRAGDFPRTCKLIRELTDGFAGVTDMPPLDFIPELMEVYPDTKVVLVTRDPESWLKSIMPVAKNSGIWWLPYAMWPVPGWRWFPALVREFGRSGNELLTEKTDQMEGDPLPTTAILENWNNKVKAMVPPEKLLIMNLKEGWEPLCRFLYRPVPNEPLPRANDTAAAGQAAQSIITTLGLIWLGILSMSGGVAYGAWKLWSSH